MAAQAYPVAVIGAGPVGLAAAAHLIERGETPVIFEAGAAVGANIRDWAHVRMFSPWEFVVDTASRRLLEATGWQMPQPDALPTGRDLIDLYLTPLAALPAMRDALHLNARVTGICRKHIDKMKDAQREAAPFVLHVAMADGSETRIEARAVIDASGTWHMPNPIGAGGLPAVGETRCAAHIHAGIPDIRGAARQRYAGKRVLVVGSGHSAINALLDLAALREEEPDTTILWAMRGTNIARVLGGGDDDALPARGQLGTRLRDAMDKQALRVLAPFRVAAIEAGEDGLRVSGETDSGVQTVDVDEIIAATGARPNIDMLRELRLDLDPSLESPRALAPMIDPNIHSCGTVRPHGEAELRQPEKDFYIVGMKSYGRAPTFLLATGYEQVRSVVAALTGDWDAARQVQLTLPETGVCSSGLGEGDAACCGTPAPALLSLADIGTNIQTITLEGGASGGCCR